MGACSLCSKSRRARRKDLAHLLPGARLNSELQTPECCARASLAAPLSLVRRRLLQRLCCGARASTPFSEARKLNAEQPCSVATRISRYLSMTTKDGNVAEQPKKKARLMPEAAPKPADSNEVIRFHFYASSQEVRSLRNCSHVRA